MSAVSEPLRCYHCGDPFGPGGPAYRQRLAGAERAFCCLGCQAVAEAIVAGGLGAYYLNRAGAAPNPARQENDFPPEWFDREDLARQFVACCGETGREVLLAVEDIRCGACAWLIEQHLARQPGVVRANVNVSTRRVRVVWEPAQTRLGILIQALRHIGYAAYPFAATQQRDARQRQHAAALRRLFVAGFGMMQVMMYAFPQYLAHEGDVAPNLQSLMHWASLVLTLPVVFYSAQPFFQGAWRGLRAHRLGMDVPVALGIAMAFTSSVVATLTGHGAVYFDSVAMFVFFLLGGRYLEDKARLRAVQAAEALVRPLPALAHRVRPDGEEAVPATALQPGDEIRVRPGETIPADGEVLEGTSSVDESLLTGESAALHKGPGDPVIGGTLNLHSALRVRVTAIGAQSVLAGMLRLMERSLQEKPPVAALADRAAEHFVAGLLVLVLGTGAYWALHDPSRLIPIAVAMLVVSCPCALSLATPAALAAATTTAMKQGVLITRGHALETLARATHFVFDKTGTLTEGRLELVGIETLGTRAAADCLSLALQLEGGSEHPIARALRNAGGAAAGALTGTNVPGQGVEAVLDGQRYRLGQRTFVMALAPATRARVPGGTPHTEVWLGSQQALLARFTFSDRLRPEAPALIARLRRDGLKLSILSGDRPEVATALGAELGIDDARGGLTPAGKLEAIRLLQRQGAIVAMVGDGINDAPSLGGAAVSIALGRAADSVQHGADVVVLASGLVPLAGLVVLARRTLALIRQNLWWALGYNLAAIPLAAGGFVTPWMAGLGMSLSSLLVVSNALRLTRAARAGPPTASAP